MIWNTGRAWMLELKKATDLSCEVGKTLGLDENFGVGAKVSSLPNNRLGMRIRSCKSGRVSEIIIGEDPEQGLYVRLSGIGDGKTDTVIDVTAVAHKEGRDTSYDWTEVMLLGNSERTRRRNRWRRCRRARRHLLRNAVPAFLSAAAKA